MDDSTLTTTDETGHDNQWEDESLRLTTSRTGIDDELKATFERVSQFKQGDGTCDVVITSVDQLESELLVTFRTPSGSTESELMSVPSYSGDESKFTRLCQDNHLSLNEAESLIWRTVQADPRTWTLEVESTAHHSERRFLERYRTPAVGIALVALVLFGLPAVVILLNTVV